MNKKKYDRDFKRSAVELAVSEGKTFREVAKDLGVDIGTLRAWRYQLIGEIKKREPEKLTSEELARENKQLRQENEYLKRQREILKKAMSILGAEPNGDMR